MQIERLWQKVVVSANTVMAEALSNVFNELGAGGVDIEDPLFINNYIKGNENVIWDYCDIEPVIKTDFVKITAYFKYEKENWEKFLQLLTNKIAFVFEIFGEKFQKQFLIFSLVNESEWENAWKEFFKVQNVGKNFILKPSWEKYENITDCKKIIEIDPGMAFGSGTHETTQMCIELMENIKKNLSVVWDVGCGSGILSIAGAKLNAEKVYAVDNDLVAVDVAKKNIILNKVDDIVEVRKGNLLDVFLEDETACLIVANIIADVIIKMLPEAQKKQKKQGLFLASGIIEEKEKEVRAAFFANNYKIVQKEQKGSWIAFLAEKI